MQKATSSKAPKGRNGADYAVKFVISDMYLPSAHHSFVSHFKAPVKTCGGSIF